jgi:REP element-mobilizing transposase RayT
MPRKPRLHYPGAVYHVILRGNSGQDVFFDAGDRTRFFLLLQESVERFGNRVHAFCLMTTHTHLAIQVGDIPLSRIMQNIGFRYTQFINRKYQRTGHLFQGRYKALLIDADSYLLELIRYIHLNPVRAGMVRFPDEYPWSSHSSYFGDSPRPPWLTMDWVLAQFAQPPEAATKRYGAFIEDGLGEGHRKDFHRGSFEGRALGDDAFIDLALLQAAEARAVAINLDQFIESVCSVYQLTAAELRRAGKAQPAAEARALAALLVRNCEALSLVRLADFLKRDLSGLSQAARRIERRIGSDALLAKKLDEVSRSLRISDCQA